uniref:Putative ovule protein n=1 Tax=Solanum chacoense TaxID=4108 RepID=A0A0V0H7S2_SOLCH
MDVKSQKRMNIWLKEISNPLLVCLLDINMEVKCQKRMNICLKEFFFLMDDLKLGKTLTMGLPSSLQMLPKKVPFSLKELPNLVKHFSFTNDSPQANPWKKH